MTFYQKLMADHPNWDAPRLQHTIEQSCPDFYGYERAQSKNCDCNSEQCHACWNREMDLVNAPNHYCVGGYECWDVMEAVFGKEALYHFSLCNTFKYLFRAGKKDDLIQDLRKAAKYIEKAIEVKSDDV